MPRRPRLEITDVPQHVLQRCQRGRIAFLRPCDYQCYLEQLCCAGLKHGCDVHAYALLPESVQLLVTGHAPGAVASMMQHLGQRYTRYANARDGARGPLWMGRYLSCPVGGRDYVIKACGHVERSPVRLRVATTPVRYPWSSFGVHAHGAVDPIVSPHRAYLALGQSDVERQRIYRHAVATSSLIDKELTMHTCQGCAWGSARFLEKVAGQYGHGDHPRPRGRPPKTLATAPSTVLKTLSPFLLTSWLGVAETLRLGIIDALNSL